MSRSIPRSRGALVVAIAALVAAACAGGDDVASVTTPEPTSAATTTTRPLDVAGATTTPETAAPTTQAPPPTVADTTATTTLPPSTTTTTTEPIAVQELLLRGDGIGSARFGAAPDGVIDYVTSILGGNTGDTGWVDPLTFAVCDGEVARRVDWGVLSLLFSDLSDFANGRRHFMGYEYGRVGQIGDDPVGLRTPGGTTLGSRVVDLVADFPDAAINAGEEEINIPPNFYVSDY
ncbi:MAG: hypothetical protein HKN41_05590, partial [Ilumatobacter sp.]|nr:hypothetical protein [Ilumatobacter sp.]